MALVISPYALVDLATAKSMIGINGTKEAIDAILKS